MRLDSQATSWSSWSAPTSTARRTSGLYTACATAARCAKPVADVMVTAAGSAPAGVFVFVKAMLAVLIEVMVPVIIVFVKAVLAVLVKAVSPVVIVFMEAVLTVFF